MPIYVILAYAIFCVVPLAMGVAYSVRYRRLIRQIDRQPRAAAMPSGGREARPLG